MPASYKLPKQFFLFCEKLKWENISICKWELFLLFHTVQEWLEIYYRFIFEQCDLRAQIQSKSILQTCKEIHKLHVFEKHFRFNLPYPTAKSFSNQLPKTFSHWQMDIFCHFHISHNRKIASAHSIFFARFRRRKGKKFRKNGRLSSMGLLAFLFTIFMQCIDCH